MIYVQLDENDIVIGISALSGNVDDSKLVNVEKFDTDYLYRKYENGQFSDEKFEPTPVEPPLSPIDMLGMVTTQSSLELSELKQQVEAIGQGVVEIMLNQQMGGM